MSLIAITSNNFKEEILEESSVLAEEYLKMIGE